MIEKLMTEFSEIPKNYISRGENFNIFQILGVGNKEDTHSTFLGELLNCKGTHGQNNLFLKLFVEHFNINFDFTTAEISLEHNIGGKTDNKGGRIDIFIRDKKQNCIIIENKIYAGDQENQMLRYYNYGEKFTNAKLFYLTLWGGQPTQFSTAGLLATDYQCISYATGIRDWLDKCLEKTTDFPILRESISQYLNLIKSLTHQTNNNDMNDKIVKSIFSSDEKLEAYLKLISIKEIEAQVYLTILQKFRSQSAIVAKELNLKFEFNMDTQQFGFENELMDKYNVHISFEFEQKNIQNLLFGFKKNDSYGSVSDRIAKSFDKVFPMSINSYWFPCYVLHKDWSPKMMVQNDEMKDSIKTQVEKMLEIIASIDKNSKTTVA